MEECVKVCLTNVSVHLGSLGLSVNVGAREMTETQTAMLCAHVEMEELVRISTEPVIASKGIQETFVKNGATKELTAKIVPFNANVQTELLATRKPENVFAIKDGWERNVKWSATKNDGVKIARKSVGAKTVSVTGSTGNATARTVTLGNFAMNPATNFTTGLIVTMNA